MLSISSYASGEISVAVNCVSNENNKNVNTEAYNKKSNGTNNNTLTDNLGLDIWDFETAASPTGSAADYVHMKVGPYLSSNTKNSGRIGFSFKNAIGYFNMPALKCGSGSGILLKIAKSLVKSTQYIYTWTPALCGDWPGELIASTWTADGNYYVLDIPGYSSISYKMSGGTYVDSSDKTEVSSSGVWIFNSSSQKFVYNSAYSTDSSGLIYSQTRMGTNFGGFNYNTFAFEIGRAHV